MYYEWFFIGYEYDSCHYLNQDLNICIYVSLILQFDLFISFFLWLHGATIYLSCRIVSVQPDYNEPSDQQKEKSMAVYLETEVESESL